MGEIAVPAKVVEAVRIRWPALAPGWLEDAPDELARLCERYGGRPLRTFNARYGFVVEVATAHGPLIMRSTPDPLGMCQANVSRALSRMGVGPHIYEVE